jgi:hypothetical protein
LSQLRHQNQTTKHHFPVAEVHYINHILSKHICTNPLFPCLFVATFQKSFHNFHKTRMFLCTAIPFHSSNLFIQFRRRKCFSFRYIYKWRHFSLHQ